MSDVKHFFSGLSEKIRLTEYEGKSFFQNLIVRSALAASGLFNLASWAVLALVIKPDRSMIILHYNVYFGVDIVGVWQQAYIVPSIGLLFLGVNTFLARWFYEKQERIAAYLLLLASLMIEFGVLVASGSVALINY